MVHTLGVLLVLLALMATAQDALVTDPDKYTLVLENERVRVLGIATSLATRPSRIAVRTSCSIHSVASSAA